MRTLRLLIEYDGTGFLGWQKQSRGRTVQGVLEEVFRRIAGRPVHVTGASRTDSGVHATGQVVSVPLEVRLDDATLLRALNAHLPEDVAVKAVETVPAEFNAIRDAVRKRYLYRVECGAAPSPLLARYCHHVRPPLDVAAMRAAAAYLLGTHDFTAMSGTCDAGLRDPVRTVRSIEILETVPGRVEMAVEADGFLYHMVRFMAATLLAAGGGRMAPPRAGEILASRDRSRAPSPAPAKGLCLVKVWYSVDNPDGM
ncbi:MAG: tRNA pseudouridine(38-40) synthase TruA [Planctomycetota bacterium]